jgi:16S rRNA (cytosine1402-N4)-methyltransferase
MTTPASSRSSGSEPWHEPVLVDEVVTLLSPRADGVYVDATVGLGGHARAVLAAGAGRLIGIDRDARAIEQARERLAEWADRVVLVHDAHERIGDVLAARGVPRVDGVLADLGVSSMQLDQPDRGFSFRQSGPLDMRMDQSRGQTLAEKLATVDERALADVIWQYGEERRSRRVARFIIEARDRGGLTDTSALASTVRRGVGAGTWQRIDPATRTFQALRIWVNDEIEGLGRFVQVAWDAVAVGGRLLIISFHSLEDRIVKQAFRRLAEDTSGARLLTRRPIVAGDEECDRNPRARSARLRAIERLA